LIETGSYQDKDDKLWQYFIAFEVEGEGEQERFHFVGMISFYEFFRDMNTKRARISQQFIVPCYQRMGLGLKLLDVSFIKF